MKHLRAKWIVLPCLMGLLVGCSGDGDGTAVSTISPLAAKAAPRAKDAKGHTLTWQRHVNPQTPTPAEGRSTRKPEARDPLALPDNELAEALRPVTLAGSEEYIGEPANRLVAAMRANRSQRKTTSYKPPTLKEADPRAVGRAGGVIGDDEREVRRDNTTFPMSTVVNLHYNTNNSNNETNCSGTVIGPSTVLTAAHCVHNGIDWIELPYFSPGTDWQDASWNSGTAYPYGIYGCYSIAVPGGWITGSEGGDDAYDYAVAEFSYCGEYFGNDTGWKAMWVYGDSDISNATGYVYGHPCSKTQPQIWGMSGSPGSFVANGAFIIHTLDASRCMSGSGLYTYADNYPYVLGIDKGIWAQDVSNFGVRINEAVFDFVIENSAL